MAMAAGGKRPDSPDIPDIIKLVEGGKLAAMLGVGGGGAAAKSAGLETLAARDENVDGGVVLLGGLTAGCWMAGGATVVVPKRCESLEGGLTCMNNLMNLVWM